MADLDLAAIEERDADLGNPPGGLRANYTPAAEDRRALLEEVKRLRAERDEARAALAETASVRDAWRTQRDAYKLSRDTAREQRDGWHKAAEKRARRIVELECERNAIARAALAYLEPVPGLQQTPEGPVFQADALVAWEKRQREAEARLRELLGPAT